MIRSVPAPARALLLCLGLVVTRSVLAVPLAPAPQTITGTIADRPLAGGYSLSGILTARTGQPFTVSTAQDLNLDGNLTDRPITDVGIERVDDGRVRLALTRPVEAFVVSDGRAEGAVGRNTFSAAAFVNLDVAFSKAFRFGDRHTAVARVEVFNAFNRAHFGIPVRVLEAPGFGASSTTLRPARVVQFALRYSF